MLGNHAGSLRYFIGEIISIEVDLRSREKEGRTVHMFVDKKQSPLFFYGLPEGVKIGILFSQPESIEFESFEQLRESSVMEVEGGFGYKFEGERVLGGEPDVSLTDQLGLSETAPVEDSHQSDRGLPPARFVWEDSDSSSSMKSDEFSLEDSDEFSSEEYALEKDGPYYSP